MRLLLVEDNAGFAGNVEGAVRDIPQCELVWVTSRDSALVRLRADSYDLVLLDRRIFSADGVLDDDIEHGWSVFQFVRAELPGTPVWFLTGSEDVDFAAELNNDYPRTGDIHGKQSPEGLYQVFWKRRINDCVRKIREFAADRVALDRIAVRCQPGALVLKAEESRILRLFARRHNGSATDVTSLNGGLSNSRVLKVVVRDAANAPQIVAAAKVSSQTEAHAEAERYRTEISRLTPGGFPQMTEKIDVGAGNFAGLFYGMIGDDVESLFHRLASCPDTVAASPTEIHRIERPWYQAKHTEPVQIGQIRRRLIGDVAFQATRSELNGIDIAPIESRVVNAAHCCQHGDLHCANVVFVRSDQPMLIDFGDTGSFFAAIDPITLELSTVFHSQRASLPAGWPTEENMAHWVDLDSYLNGCSFPAFIRACRDWAIGEAASQEEVIGAAYAYAVRQLKYPDTNKGLARALIRACLNYFA